MRFSKKVIKADETLLFEFKNDDAYVTSNRHYGQPVTLIDFGLLMDSVQREQALKALASEFYFDKNRWLNYFQLPVTASEKFFFTEEDYDFMEYLQTQGLALELAAVTALLTNVYDKATAAERIVSFDDFFERGHSLQLCQSVNLTGPNTFAIYYVISQIYNVEIASAVSFKVQDNPLSFLNFASTLGDFFTNRIDVKISKEQLDILLSFTQNLPRYIADSKAFSSDLEHSNKLTEFLIDFTIAIDDWSKVSAISQRFVKELNPSVLGFYQAEAFTGRGRDHQEIMNSVRLLSMLHARFKEETITKALGVLEANKSDLTEINGEHFLALVVLCEHLSTGGSASDSLDWVFAMDTSISADKVLSRAGDRLHFTSSHE